MAKRKEKLSADKIDKILEKEKQKDNKKHKKQMFKSIAITLAVMLVLFAVGYAIYSYNKPDELGYDLTVNEAEIEQIIRDIYTPESMKEFQDSKFRHLYTTMTNGVAENLYCASSSELSEYDLKRKINSIEVNHCSAENSSDGIETYIADTWLEYYDGSKDHFEVYFYIGEEGIIDDYDIQLLESVDAEEDE